MAKRKTKEQREAEEKAALRRRVDDIFLGAVGYKSAEEDGEPWPEQFITFCVALKQAFLVEGDSGNEWMWTLDGLSNFCNPESATEFLYRNGVRA